MPFGGFRTFPASASPQPHPVYSVAAALHILWSLHQSRWLLSPSLCHCAAKILTLGILWLSRG